MRCVSLEIAGAQLFDGVRPILLRRAFGTSAALPEFVCEFGDFVVSKTMDAVSNCRLLTVVGMLVVGDVFRVIRYFGRAADMGALIAQFGFLLLMGGMNSAVILFRHST